MGARGSVGLVDGVVFEDDPFEVEVEALFILVLLFDDGKVGSGT